MPFGVSIGCVGCVRVSLGLCSLCWTRVEIDRGTCVGPRVSVCVCCVCIYPPGLLFARVSFVASRSCGRSIPIHVHRDRVLCHTTMNIVNVGRHCSRAADMLVRGMQRVDYNFIHIQSIGRNRIRCMRLCLDVHPGDSEPLVPVPPISN